MFERKLKIFEIQYTLQSCLDIWYSDKGLKLLLIIIGKVIDPNGGVFPIIIIMKKKTRRNKMTKFIHQKLVGTCIVKELYSKEF